MTGRRVGSRLRVVDPTHPPEVFPDAIPAFDPPECGSSSRSALSRSSSSTACPRRAGSATPADDAAVIAYLDAQVADAGYPGASIAIVRGGHVAELHAIGAADRTGRPVDHGHAVRHRLRLQVPDGARHPAPGGRPVRWTSTRPSRAMCRVSGRRRRPLADHHPRRRSTHTSGLPGSAIDLSSPVSTIAGQVASLAAVQPAAAPGARYAYANANYVVLGAVIEAVSGESYPDGDAGRSSSSRSA